MYTPTLPLRKASPRPATPICDRSASTHSERSPIPSPAVRWTRFEGACETVCCAWARRRSHSACASPLLAPVSTITESTLGVWAPYTHSCRMWLPSSLPGPKLELAIDEASSRVTSWHGSKVFCVPWGEDVGDDGGGSVGDEELVACDAGGDAGGELVSAAVLALPPQAVRLAATTTAAAIVGTGLIGGSSWSMPQWTVVRVQCRIRSARIPARSATCCTELIAPSNRKSTTSSSVIRREPR